MLDEKIKIKNFAQLERLDILCGYSISPPIFACEICGKESCVGVGKCKGYGAYRLGVSLEGK